MIIFPAIDLSEGKIVRLSNGDFDKKKVYSHNLEKQIKIFENSGAKWIHVVDLDGALTGKSKNAKAIEKISNLSHCKIQLGGGIRTLSRIEQWLKLGIDRIIVGTEAIKNPSFVKEAVRNFPNKVAVGLDLLGNYVAIDGWTKVVKEKKADYFFKKFSDLSVECIIYTDINKDGILKGPNIKNTLYYKKAIEVPLIASGGVSSYSDLLKLKKNNVYGVIIGKAIYEKKIDIEKVINIK
ncbi:MAG: 1-(5-phosphoribosyl)-5-[(5-phosphoribosylamino)methylideneamino]imidazole-4-carboxamide isomerase [Rickettsiales bacterium]|nr:1-(5-phosphoribosyl)-5-[(5-phosphoribosylamino)methylideneamino]imidazole-4-carboxamide isomerase [Rickettsiales bacterium]